MVTLVFLGGVCGYVSIPRGKPQDKYYSNLTATIENFSDGSLPDNDNPAHFHSGK